MLDLADLSDLRRRARIERERRKRLAEDKDAAEEDLLAFVRLMWRALEPATPLVLGWPLEALADALMAVSDGHIMRLLINIFPGACKSSMLNVFFPAWEWGPRRKPHLRYISASYTSLLTERDNMRFLRVVTDATYRELWPHVVVNRDAVVQVGNTRAGWKLATSVSGTVTGQRGNRFLLDDANNPFDVESDVVRARTSLFLREVMPDRLADLERDAIISIQHRVHEEDATGVLAEYGQDYTWMSIPMRFDPLRIFPVVLRRDADGEPTDVWHDPRGLDADGAELDGLYTDAHGEPQIRPGSPMAQVEGRLAWPARFPEQVVDEQEKIKGAYAWAAQYQQAPTTRGGAIVRRDWWRTWTDTAYPDLGTVIASLDTAQEEKTQNDYNAFLTFGAFEGEAGAPQMILTSAWHERCQLAVLVARVAEACYRQKVDFLLIEKKTRGRDVYDEMLRLYASAPWQSVLIEPRGDKVSRLKAVSHLFSGDVRRDPISGVDVYGGGMIWAPLTDWADAVQTEVASFPHGAHDDYVDCVSMGLSFMRKNGVVLRKAEYDAAELAARTYRREPAVPYAIARRA